MAQPQVKIELAPTFPKERSAARTWVTGLLKDKAVILSLCIIIIALGAAIFAPWVAPKDPIENDLARTLRPPVVFAGGNWDTPLGTDYLGRDILSRVIYGARITLTISLSATVMAAVIGITLGLIAGFYGKWADEVIMRFADVQVSIPFLMLAVLVAAVLSPSFKTTIVVLGVTSWVIYGRLVRGETLRIRNLEFVQAARALGATDARILFRHILPNLISPIIVITSFTMAQMIVYEASLSFLGLGVKPPNPSWGVMMADGRGYLWNAWWVATIPGIAVALVVLAVNLFGDWLRDRLDPRMRTM